MSGVRLLSYLQLGKETTKGTSVAATRRMDPDLSSSFTVDWMKRYHDDRQTGTYNNVTYSTRVGELVNITYRTPADTGLAYDQLPFFQVFPAGGTAGSASGGAGGTTYAWTHSMGGTATGSALSYTFEFGDDVQEFEAEYCQPSRVRISAETQGLTQLEADFFGRQSTKSTKTALNSVDPVRIRGYDWQLFHPTSFGGGTTSAIPNFLVSWDLEYNTGLVPRFYLDGNQYFGQSVQSVPMTGNLHMMVESNSTAISQYYDKGNAGTIDYVRLRASGPAFAGGTAYSTIFDLAVDYTSVVPLSSEADGVNLYDVTARLVYDSSAGKALTITTTNALATLSA